MDNLKEKILKSVPIEAYIGKFVSLKKQGQNLVGLCPFHKEKTPSFSVSPSKGLFYCFGCGRGGNIITFVMEKEHVSFREALEILARFAGISLNPSDYQKFNKIYNLLDSVNEEYRKFLKLENGKKYYDYILSRGVNPDMIVKFQIGAVGNDPAFISERFANNHEELHNIGLIKKKDNTYYDFFRNRIIFPIHNIDGKIVGFGGRSIDDIKPKYLNSPESAIFHKGSMLYGMFQGINEIRKSGEVFITEGYLDVIGLHQIGVYNVVAPLGTSFTEEHKKLLLRFAQSFYLLMDGDEAGRNSIYRILLLFYDSLDKVKIIFLPQGKDLFDLSKEFQSQRFSYNFNFLKEKSISAISYLLYSTIMIDKMETLFDIDDPILLNERLEEIFQIEKLSDYFKSLSIGRKQIVIQKVAELIKNIKDEVFSEILTQEFEKILKINLKTSGKEFNQRENFLYQLPEKKENQIDKKNNLFYLIEKEIIGLFFLSPPMIYKYFDRINQVRFYNEAFYFVWNILYDKFIIKGQNPEISELISLLPSEMQEIFVSYVIKNVSSYIENEYELETIMEELIIKHRIEEINRLINEKSKEIFLSGTGEETKVFLYQELNKLIKEKQLLISNLRGSQ